jgi:NADP-dependent 3-hydroxy acid dehydrogenase YdfG
VVPYLRERRAGMIINVTSSVGQLPMPLVASYTDLAAMRRALPGEDYLAPARQAMGPK